jgi:hypothetical protein
MYIDRVYGVRFYNFQTAATPMREAIAESTVFRALGLASSRRTTPLRELFEELDTGKVW